MSVEESDVPEWVPTEHDYVSISPAQITSDRHQDYQFEYVSLSDIPDDLGVKNTRVYTGSSYAVYQYGDNDPVMVTELGGFMPKGADRQQARKDLYHFLSILDSKGVVSRFTKS